MSSTGNRSSTSRFPNKNLNVSSKPSQSSGPQTQQIRGGSMLLITQNKGTISGKSSGSSIPIVPTPLNTPSLRKEMGGKDTSVNLVLGGNSAVWGGATTPTQNTQETKTEDNKIKMSTVSTTSVSRTSNQAPWAKPNQSPETTAMNAGSPPVFGSKSSTGIKNWADDESDDDDNIGIGPESDMNFSGKRRLVPNTQIPNRPPVNKLNPDEALRSTSTSFMNQSSSSPNISSNKFGSPSQSNYNNNYNNNNNNNNNYNDRYNRPSNEYRRNNYNEDRYHNNNNYNQERDRERGGDRGDRDRGDRDRGGGNNSPREDHQNDRISWERGISLPPAAVEAPPIPTFQNSMNRFNTNNTSGNNYNKFGSNQSPNYNNQPPDSGNGTGGDRGGYYNNRRNSGSGSGEGNSFNMNNRSSNTVTGDGAGGGSPPYNNDFRERPSSFRNQGPSTTTSGGGGGGYSTNTRTNTTWGNTNNNTSSNSMDAFDRGRSGPANASLSKDPDDESNVAAQIEAARRERERVQRLKQIELERSQERHQDRSPPRERSQETDNRDRDHHYQSQESGGHHDDYPPSNQYQNERKGYHTGGSSGGGPGGGYQKEYYNNNNRSGNRYDGYENRERPGFNKVNAGYRPRDREAPPSHESEEVTLSSPSNQDTWARVPVPSERDIHVRKHTETDTHQQITLTANKVQIFSKHDKHDVSEHLSSSHNKSSSSGKPSQSTSHVSEDSADVPETPQPPPVPITAKIVDPNKPYSSLFGVTNTTTTSTTTTSTNNEHVSLTAIMAEEQQQLQHQQQQNSLYRKKMLYNPKDGSFVDAVGDKKPHDLDNHDKRHPEDTDDNQNEEDNGPQKYNKFKKSTYEKKEYPYKKTTSVAADIKARKTTTDTYTANKEKSILLKKKLLKEEPIWQRGVTLKTTTATTTTSTSVTAGKKASVRKRATNDDDNDDDEEGDEYDSDDDEDYEDDDDEEEDNNNNEDDDNDEEDDNKDADGHRIRKPVSTYPKKMTKKLIPSKVLSRPSNFITDKQRVAVEESNRRRDEDRERIVAKEAEIDPAKAQRTKERLNRRPRTEGYLFKYNEYGELEQVLLDGEKPLKIETVVYIPESSSIHTQKKTEMTGGSSSGNNMSITTKNVKPPIKIISEPTKPAWQDRKDTLQVLGVISEEKKVTVTPSTTATAPATVSTSMETSKNKNIVSTNKNTQEKTSTTTSTHPVPSSTSHSHASSVSKTQDDRPLPAVIVAPPKSSVSNKSNAAATTTTTTTHTADKSAMTASFNSITTATTSQPHIVNTTNVPNTISSVTNIASKVTQPVTVIGNNNNNGTQAFNMMNATTTNAPATTYPYGQMNQAYPLQASTMNNSGNPGNTSISMSTLSPHDNIYTMNPDQDIIRKERDVVVGSQKISMKKTLLNKNVGMTPFGGLSNTTGFTTATSGNTGNPNDSILLGNHHPLNVNNTANSHSWVTGLPDHNVMNMNTTNSNSTNNNYTGLNNVVPLVRSNSNLDNADRLLMASTHMDTYNLDFSNTGYNPFLSYNNGGSTGGLSDRTKDSILSPLDPIVLSGTSYDLLHHNNTAATTTTTTTMSHLNNTTNINSTLQGTNVLNNINVSESEEQGVGIEGEELEEEEEDEEDDENQEQNTQSSNFRKPSSTSGGRFSRTTYGRGSTTYTSGRTHERGSGRGSRGTPVSSGRGRTLREGYKGRGLFAKGTGESEDDHERPSTTSARPTREPYTGRGTPSTNTSTNTANTTVDKTFIRGGRGSYRGGRSERGGGRESSYTGRGRSYEGRGPPRKGPPALAPSSKE